MNWTHESLYAALEARLGRSTKSDTGEYVCLYEQEPPCAVLFAHCEGRMTPIRLYPCRESWREDVYRTILPAIEAIRLEQKVDPRFSFIGCDVRDWNLFARLLRLDHDD